MIIYKVYKQFFKPTIYFILLSILKIIYPLIKSANYRFVDNLNLNVLANFF